MAGHRVIKGLRWARLSPDGPPGISATKRPRGAKREGIKYENSIAKAFGPTAKHGQWITFEDSNGLGWAQPDILFPHDGFLFVLEAKYTWVPEAHTQLSDLYIPLLREIFSDKKEHIRGIVIVKTLVPMAKTKFICSTMERAMHLAKMDSLEAPVLQWLGSGPLWTEGRGRATLLATELGI